MYPAERKKILVAAMNDHDSIRAHKVKKTTTSSVVPWDGLARLAGFLNMYQKGQRLQTYSFAELSWVALTVTLLHDLLWAVT
jgi:hypothetical protein